MIGLGTIINTAAIILGGMIGLFAGRLFKQEQQESINKACGISIKQQALSNFEIMTHEGNERIEHGYYKILNGQMSLFN